MKVLYLANPLQGSTGGDRRSYEVLKRVGGLGIEPVIVVDETIWRKMKRNGNNQFSPFQKIYCLNRPNVIYDKKFKSASRAALDYISIYKTSREIAQIAKQEKVDLIVSHHEKIDFICEAYLAAKRLDLPWTCVFQLALFPPYASTKWRPVGQLREIYLLALYAWLFKIVKKAAKSTSLLAVSPSIENEIKRYFPDWEGKMEVLKPGLGVKSAEISGTEASKEKIDLLFYSRMVPEKGIFDLPKIAAELTLMNPKVRLVVVGKFDSPHIQRRFEQAVAESGAAVNLVYKGFVEEQKLYSFLKAAKVLVYPSLHDSFSLVVLEALAAGTPVVAYGIAAMKLNFPADLVRTVSIRDWKAMALQAQKLMDNSALRREFSTKAEEFAAKFVWDRVAEAETQAYSKIMWCSI